MKQCCSTDAQSSGACPNPPGKSILEVKGTLGYITSISMDIHQAEGSRLPVNVSKLPTEKGL